MEPHRDMTRATQTVSSLGARSLEASGQSGQTLLHLRNVDVSGAEVVVEVDVETDTAVTRCPNVTVVVRSAGSVVGQESLSTEGDFVIYPPTIDFFRCLGATRIRLDSAVSAQDAVSFEVWEPDLNGVKIAEGAPTRLADLEKMPDVPDDSIGAVVQSSVQPVINVAIGAAGAYLLWDNIDTISNLFD